MGRETDRRHILVKSQCFAQFGIRSAACRVMFPQQSVETKRCENIREQDSRWTQYSTLQHALCWTPAPRNLNVSARVLLKVMIGVWFFSSIGANAFQATLTLNFGGEGVVPDRRGLNISSIYGITSEHLIDILGKLESKAQPHGRTMTEPSGAAAPS